MEIKKTFTDGKVTIYLNFQWNEDVKEDPFPILFISIEEENESSTITWLKYPTYQLDFSIDVTSNSPDLEDKISEILFDGLTSRRNIYFHEDEFLSFSTSSTENIEDLPETVEYLMEDITEMVLSLFPDATETKIPTTTRNYVKIHTSFQTTVSPLPEEDEPLPHSIKIPHKITDLMVNPEEYEGRNLTAFIKWLSLITLVKTEGNKDKFYHDLYETMDKGGEIILSYL